MLMGNVLLPLLWSFWMLCIGKTSALELKVNTNTSHPCHRQCVAGDTRTCVYNWIVHLHRVMGPECRKCPENITDCSRLGCVTAGGDRRAMFIVDFSFPGPAISVCKDDTIEVVVSNYLMEDTALTIHWHGIHQIKTVFMDGVPMVTQCPIVAGTSFKYRFKAYPAGTHFWHAHTGLKSSDGVAGPLIVRLPKDPHGQLKTYDYDLPEHTVFMQEWMPRLTTTAFTELHGMTTGSNGAQHVSKQRLKRRQKNANLLAKIIDQLLYTPENSKKAQEAMRPTDALLINGRSSGHTNDLPLSVFNVTKGYKYRFRVIFNGITTCPVTLSIDQHDVTLIALDGQPIKRIDGVGKILFQAGERVDLVVNANQPVKNYWIYLEGSMDCEGLFGLAVLHYEGAKSDNFLGVIDPEVRTSNRTFNVFSGKSDANNIYLADAENFDHQKRTHATRRIYISSDVIELPDRALIQDTHMWPMHVRRINGKNFLVQIDGRSYEATSSPLATQYHDISKSTFCDHVRFSECPPQYCKCTNIKNIRFRETVDLVIYDQATITQLSHPFHIHGYFVQVLQSGTLGIRNASISDLEAVLNNDRLDHRSEVACWKDNFVLPQGGYIVVRLHANNPGPWFFHCHINFHVNNGMALTFKVGEPSHWPLPAKNFPRCGNFL